MNLYQLFQRGIGTAIVSQVSLSTHHYYAVVIRVQQVAPWKWVLAHFPFGLMMSKQWIGSLIGGIELGEGIQIVIHIQIQIHLGTCLILDTKNNFQRYKMTKTDVSNLHDKNIRNNSKYSCRGTCMKLKCKNIYGEIAHQFSN